VFSSFHPSRSHPFSITILPPALFVADPHSAMWPLLCLTRQTQSFRVFPRSYLLQLCDLRSCSFLESLGSNACNADCSTPEPLGQRRAQVSRLQVTSFMQQLFSAEIWSCCCLLTVETVTQTLSSSIFILHCLFCGLSNIHTTASPQDYKTQPQKLSSQPISLSTSSPPSTPPKILSFL